jgi:hypothetical protein
MRTQLRLLAALLGVTIGAIAAITPASGAPRRGAYATSDEISDNWAGYVITAGKPVRRVVGTWVQPGVACDSPAHRYAAFWVGIGGFRSSAHALEQIGTEADCASQRTSTYAWYELLPSGEVPLRMKVHPGDRMAASVTVRGKMVALHLHDLSTGSSFAKSLRMGSPDTSSAEWIAEAPSACAGANQRCQTLPLADFSRVRFSDASAATLGGPSRAISSPLFDATQVTLESSGIGFGVPGRAIASSSNEKATPSALADSGSSFTITWEAGPQTRPPSSPGLATFSPARRASCLRSPSYRTCGEA